MTMNFLLKLFAWQIISKFELTKKVKTEWVGDESLIVGVELSKTGAILRKTFGAVKQGGGASPVIDGIGIAAAFSNFRKTTVNALFKCKERLKKAHYKSQLSHEEKAH
jgi:hypothetical protein